MRNKGIGQIFKKGFLFKNLSEKRVFCNEIELFSGLPDYSWCNIPKRGKYTKMTAKYTKWP
jgi:hypothetical protein